MRICKPGCCFSRGARLRSTREIVKLLVTVFVLAAYLTHCAGAISAWIPCNPDDPKACRFGAICRPLNTGPSVYAKNDSALGLHICQCPSLACLQLDEPRSRLWRRWQVMYNADVCWRVQFDEFDGSKYLKMIPGRN